RPSFNCRLLQVPACIDWSNCSLTHVRTHQLDGNSASSADKGAVHLIAAPCRRAQSEHLKLGVAGRTRKGDHVANVLHAGEVEEHAFEAKTEASVRHCAESTQIEIPKVGLLGHFLFLHALLEYVESFFTLGAADDLANSRNKDVHAPHGT